MNDRNPIGWCSSSLNLAVGCDGTCDYCYARRQAKRLKRLCHLCADFLPHWHFARLKQLTPRQKPRVVFMDSMSDWGCKRLIYEVPDVIQMVQTRAPQHCYVVLTKQPWNLEAVRWPANWWVGVSITGDALEDLRRVTPLERRRLQSLARIASAGAHTVVSWEPALGGGAEWMMKEAGLAPGWLIIGGLSPKKWANDVMCARTVVEELDWPGPLWVKDNFPLADGVVRRQERPKAMEEWLTRKKGGEK